MNKKEEKAAKMFALMHENGIKTVSLKGAAIRDLYPVPQWRTMGDIDVLVSADDMERIRELFSENGYEVKGTSNREWDCYGEGYEEAYRIALLLIVPVTISLIQNLGIAIQRAKNLHKYRSIIYFIIAVLNVAVSIPLSMKYGGTGAAMGTAASLLLGNGFIMNWMYHKIIGINIIYFWKQILKFIPALILPTIAGFVIMIYINYSSIWMFLLMISLYVILYSISMWFFGINQYEKALILEPIKLALNKIKK